MTWTKEKPKNSGYYWLRGCPVEGIIFLHMSKISVIGDERSLSINDSYFKGGEWYGPLEPPKGE